MSDKPIEIMKNGNTHLIPLGSSVLLAPEDSRRVADAIISAIDQLMRKRDGPIGEMIETVGENVRRGIDEAICTGPHFVDAVRGAVESAILERDSI